MNRYGRNRLAQIVLQKTQNDERLSQIDHQQWYQMFQIDQLNHLGNKFVQLNEDTETKEFLKNCYEKSEWFFTQYFHSVMLSILKIFMATTSINGLLNRGSMFVFSSEQFRTLIDFDQNYGGNKLNNLLDLGSGDGAVTKKMSIFFRETYTTEMSWTMQYRLKQYGFKVVDVDSWDKILLSNHLENDSNSNRYLKFDVISCLNLLDRCDKPYTLLKQIKNAIVQNGLLVVALVLPFNPFVEYNKDNKPLENLLDRQSFANEYLLENLYRKNLTEQPEQCILSKNNSNERFECAKKMNRTNYQISYLIENVFRPIGFELVKFSRVPYLCEGNLLQSYYFMNDYIFVFKST